MSCRNKIISPETRRNIKMAVLKQWSNPKFRDKISDGISNQIFRQKLEGGQSSPVYSFLGCAFFRYFDLIHGTKGRYGNNCSEHYIKSLKYYVDYFNEEMKIIMEWDGEGHYNNGKLRQRDLERQKKLMELYPDFLFIRVREREYLDEILNEQIGTL